jgi:DHA2 family multidrug resistance protein-like MFS transporter
VSTTVSTTPTGPRATRREWIGLLILALPCLLYSMDLTVLHLAIPKLTEDLRPTSAELLWIIDIYGFFVAGSLITMGTLGDRIGRRRLLLIGAAFFGIASVLAAFSNSSQMLIATRALLGLAGATVAPSTFSLIRNMFHDEGERTRAIALWITAYSVGGLLGPLVGGVLLEFFWWGSVFLIAVPIMVLVLITGPLLLPEYKDPNAGRPDLASAALSITSVLSAVFGLKLIAQEGFAVLPALAIVAGVVLAVIFVRRQKILKEPFIDLWLFRAPGFSASLATYALGMLIMIGGFVFLGQYLQLVLGLSPFEAGLWTLPWAIGFVVASNLLPNLAERFQPVHLMVVGLILASASFAMFARLDQSSGFPYFLIASVLFSVGFSPIFTFTNTLIMSAAPPERAGAASGISETSAELSGAVGIAVFGSLGVALYRGAIADDLGGLPADAAAAAKDTLGGALAVSATLPGPQAAQLVSSAQDAFVLGLQVAAAISTAGAIALAFFVARTLGRSRAAVGDAMAGAPKDVATPAD